MFSKAGCLVLSVLALSACAILPTQTKVVYVPVTKAPPPSPLVPQPILLFNAMKQGRKLFVLNDEFPYCDTQTGQIIVVPRYFRTDFASVPWFGQGVVDPQGPSARAAIIHDFLYAVGTPGKRKEADDIFYRAMRHFGVSEQEALIAYNAVRLGGEKGYGLKEDWVFVDPAKPEQPLRPIPKPAHGIAKRSVQCKEFVPLIKSGWKAYPSLFR